MMYSLAPVARMLEHGQVQRIGMKQRQRRQHAVVFRRPAIGAQQAAITHNMPCTVSNTPFARPVVPDVYKMKAGRRCSEADRAARTSAQS